MFDNIKNILSLSDYVDIINRFLDIPEDNLESENTLKEYQKRVIIALEYREIFKAYELLQKLKEKISNTDVNLIKKYEEVIVWLYYVSFGILSIEEIKYFFKENNIGIILQDEIYFDLINRIKLRLSTIDIKERNNWREQMYNAMHENQNNLTINFIIQGSRSTIANWLKEYDKEIGTSIAESIMRANFENESALKAHLSVDKKNILKRFLDFYEFIKISSYDPAGFEEDIVIESKGKTYFNVNGELIEVGKTRTVASRNPIPQIKEEESSLTRESNIQKTLLPSISSITAQSQKILISTKAVPSEVVSQLSKSVDSVDVANSLACIILLAQLRKLDDILLDAQFYKLVSDNLKANNNANSLEGLRINPKAPQYIARFLKIILEDKLNLSNEGAILFGHRLSKILSIESEKYNSITKDNKWNM